MVCLCAAEWFKLVSAWYWWCQAAVLCTVSHAYWCERLEKKGCWLAVDKDVFHSVLGQTRRQEPASSCICC